MEDKQKLRLEWIDPDQLAEHPENWKTHPDSQVEGLSSVISQIGWAGALLYNECTGRLLDGHARRKLDPKLYVDGKAPVLVGSWTEADERLILATLDPLAAMAQTNEEDFRALLGKLEAEQADLQGLLERLRGELDEESTDGDTDHAPPIDKAEEFLEKWKVERGQIWQAGPHRIMCGDCTDESDVARLMNGKKARLMCTDPPYGISLDLSQVHEAADAAAGRKPGT